MIQQAYVEGVSARRVDYLARILGWDGISKSQVSRICADLDAGVNAFRDRPLGDSPIRTYGSAPAIRRSERAAGSSTSRCGRDRRELLRPARKVRIGGLEAWMGCGKGHRATAGASH